MGSIHLASGKAGSRSEDGVVPLMNREHLDFSYLAAQRTEVLTLAEAVNVTSATTALIVILIHVNNIGASAQFDIGCYPTAPSGEDPLEFRDTTASLSATVDTQTAPYYLSAALVKPPRGAWWKIELTARQGDPAVDLAAQLSAFLVLRDG